MLGLSTGLMYDGFVGELEGWDPNYIHNNTSHTCLLWYDFGLDGYTGHDDGTYWLNKTDATGGDRVTAKLNPHSYTGLSSDGAFVGAGSSGNAMSDQSFNSDELNFVFVYTDQDDYWNESLAGGGFSCPIHIRIKGQANSTQYRFLPILKDYLNTSPGDALVYSPALTTPGKRFFTQWGQWTGTGTGGFGTGVYVGHGVTGDGGYTNPPYTPQLSQNNTSPQWFAYHAIDGNTSIAGKMAFGDNFSSNRWSAVDSWFPGIGDGAAAIDACMKGFDVNISNTSRWPYIIDFSVDDGDNMFGFKRFRLTGTPVTEMPWTGIVHEIIMFKGDLYSDGTYQFLQNYLVKKYGGTGLYY